jgi:hypothetical protein
LNNLPPGAILRKTHEKLNVEEVFMATRHKVIFLALACMLLSAAGCAPYQVQGGAVGGSAGELTGTRLDQRNPWRGGVVGSVPVAVASATIVEISARGSREAALREQPVEYMTEDGRGRYYAEPMAYDPSTRCRKIRERIYDDGRIVKERVKEVCAN